MARLTSRNNEKSPNKFEHNHIPDIAQTESQKIANEIKHKAKTTIDTPSMIISEISANLDESIEMKIPNSSLIKRIIHRTRSSHNHPPPCPTSLAELILPYEYTITEKGENFIIHDDEDKRATFNILH
ncbi:uncharacterized protein LOC135922680 [Gordionus sp. m RMFG-2023]|uniref:uncharacterized protein LOC135922680 n=1 Tax=Gordionus sp. m RMFG-2023 TaxID=3053472 RepID=UPI0031FBB209